LSDNHQKSTVTPKPIRAANNDERRERPALANSTAGKPASDRYFSRAIGNALRVLEVFQQSASPLALSDVVQQTKLPKSSAFRILRTLELAGYIERVEGDRFSLAHSAVIANPLVSQVVEIARPMMRQLGQEFRETISLAFLFTNHIEVVAVVDSPHRVSMGNEVGGLIPPHASSLGKCICAFQEEARREKLLRSFGMVRFTPHTIVEDRAFAKELELIAVQGYAKDLEESTLGGCCVSAPILDRRGYSVAAISISMPKIRFLNQKRVATAVMDTARAITQQLP
jgi:DNA-binding IclR family transcriptional regulator